jgi:hypothetical protein
VEFKGELFIELEDLLSGFNDPCVMDIKMGTRTFLESEVSRTVARPDLYQKVRRNLVNSSVRELIVDVNFEDGEGGPKCTKCRGTQTAGSYQTPVHEVPRAAVVDQHPGLSDRSHEGESTSFQSRRTMP